MEMSGGFLVQSRLIEDKLMPWYTTMIDIRLQYWPNDNIITDEHGEIVYNVFNMITPNDLSMFKDRPYFNMYFLHVGAEKKETVVGIGYKDSAYFEEGDYKRYPTMKSQIELRKREVARHDDKDLTELSNFEFRRRIYPELYSS